MTATVQDDPDVGNVPDRYSTRLRRIEILFFLVAVPFAAYLGIGLVKEDQYRAPQDMSSLKDIEDALSSLREIQDVVSSLRETQTILMAQMADKAIEEEFKIEDSKIQSSEEAGKVKRNLSPLPHAPRANAILTSMRQVLQSEPVLDEGSDAPESDSSVGSSVGSSIVDDAIIELTDDSIEDTTDDITDLGVDDCVTFRVDIELDGYPEETYWTLTDEGGMVVQNVSYAGMESFVNVFNESCIESGKYTFSIHDTFGDGLSCLSDLCYSITVDGQKLVGNEFQSPSIEHPFDTSSLCMFLPVLALKMQVDSEFQITFQQQIAAKTELLELQETTDPSVHMNSSVTYFICAAPAVYRLQISAENATECEDTCYQVQVGNNQPLLGPSVLDGSEYVFFMAIDGSTKERKCDAQPIISPINDFSSFAFDDRVSRTLNVIQALSSLEDIYTRGSTQYRATCYILYDDPALISPEDPLMPQRYALAVFLYATNQIPEIQLPKDPCQNFKFECNEDREIIKIDWSVEGKNGIIPTEIAHLTKLEDLILKEKDLQGTIPSELTTVNSLKTLVLDKNQLTGKIPPGLGDLPNLELISLWTNKLSGGIPSELGKLSKLEYLGVHVNDLTGTIPSEIFEATNLERLVVSANKLIGTIPSELGQCGNIWILNLENNDLSGTIPTEIRNLTDLFLLDLNSNELTGTIPTELSEITSLLDEVMLNDNLLTGTLPEMNPQSTLYVSNNSLTGEIPSAIFELNISGLKLEDNNMFGAVTEDFCANLSFVEGYDGIYDLTVDDSGWFLDEPLVECPCCDDVNCHMWGNDEIIIVGGTRKPDCPTSNVFKQSVFERYILTDLMANVTMGEGVGSGVEEELEFCLSPTGCFEMTVEDVDGRNDGTDSWDRSFLLGYSAETRSVIEHDTCDAVDICGNLIHEDHEKRMGLNHLTHVVLSDLSYLDDESSIEYQAICWIMTQDPLFLNYNACDGTLMQRYIMALFFLSQELDLELVDTCSWEGITCDGSNKFVEKIELQGKDLKGELITEIGLLTRLQTLDLSRNKLIGSIDPIIFEYLPYLEVFHVGENKFGGNVPSDLLLLPALKEVNVSNNLIVGELPNVEYAATLEIFDVENNLLIGFIPPNLTDCQNLQVINLSRNNFKGAIPSEIGKLSDLTELKLNQNILSGSLPYHIFSATNIEILQVQSNSLTGSIPTDVGNLAKAKFIALNHNSLKGPIPSEFENLTQIELLHLHTNTLTGEAPVLPHLFELGDTNRYMTDCGSPSYALANPINCQTCTTCCNSDEMCQANRIWKVPIDAMGFIVVCAVPIVCAIFLFMIHKIGRSYGVSDPRDPLLIFDEDSTYCLIFADSKLSWIMYAVTFFVQGCFYYVFLLASSFTHKSSDWQFTIRCPSTNVECKDENTVSWFGWFLFFVVTLSTLGVDFCNSAFQVRKAVFLLDSWLFMSGFLHLGMTVLAVFASYYYNMALATSNTELIVNAVILLFINDLDEQFMNVLQATFPTWIDDRIEEIRKNMSGRVDRERPSRKGDDHA